ncbi:hypothetical protein HII31_01144 [Pseudocercospora fuligena]|uniref:Uncharacterized protein n=1 Tax=Pseudocercospora fuligena TaxID=685502 RepID=A0A8H6RTS1_9PEZI|nr:hypothetical protein HII31_01144 [Pseudocercospora fuligena]
MSGSGESFEIPCQPTPHFLDTIAGIGEVKYYEPWVEAKAIWTNHAASLNDSIEALLRAIKEDTDVVRSSRNDGSTEGLYTPEGIAGVWINKQLLANPTLVDAAHFDAFCAALPVWLSVDKTELLYEQARMALIHPTSPNIEPAYRLLRGIMRSELNSPFAVSLFKETHSPAATTMAARFLIQLAQELNRIGHSSEAHEVLDFGRSQMPQTFSMRSTLVHRGPTEDQSTRNYRIRALDGDLSERLKQIRERTGDWR